MKKNVYERIWPVLSDFVTSRFYCITILPSISGPIIIYSVSLKLVPDLPPSNISASSSSSTVLKVSWNPVPRENQNGIILGYRVLLMGAWGESLRKATVQNSSQSYYQFQGLEAWTNYSVKVSAFTAKGNGPYTASLLANTDEDGMCTLLNILIQGLVKIMQINISNSCRRNSKVSSYNVCILIF